MKQHKLFIATAALAVSLGAQAQAPKCDFEENDYKSVSTYDAWEDSPFRTGQLTGQARVVDNPYKDDNNPSDKVLGFQRSRYGGMFYGARIDLNDTIALSPTTQYVHAYIYSPKGGKVGLVALGKRITRTEQEPDAEQLIVLGNMQIPEGAWADAVFPIWGNANARIMSLVIVPDASINPGSGEDFMTYIDNVTVSESASPRISTGEYALNFDADQVMTRTDRHLDRMTFRAGNVSSATTTTQCRSTVYADLTDKFTVTMKAGESVRPTYSYTGNAMHSYTYVDWDNDGKFDVDFESDEPANGSDLMSYSYYEGKNSAGQNRGSSTGVGTPVYTVPADQPRGIYRGRTKIDWNNIDPAGNIDLDNTIINNGGNIVDYLINVHTDNVQLSVDARMCSVTLADGSALPDSIPFDENLNLSVKMDDGYYLTGLRITHGYNFNGDQYIHGNRQWSVDTIQCDTQTSITIPASMIDGDVSVSVLFTNIPPVGIETAPVASGMNVSVEENTIVLRSEEEKPYRVVNAGGQVIAKGTVKGTKKLPNFPAGVYVVNDTKCVIN